MTIIEAIPHRTRMGMCPVNGIRDLIQWRTRLDWSNEFVWGLGQGGGFAYLRFKSATPPRQIYTGIATPRQHLYLAGLFNAEFSEVENRSFKFSWGKAQAALEAGIPPVIGPLDMFYLPFYPEIYQKRHTPIHFLLLVGADEEQAFVLDTLQEEVQAIPLDDLKACWDVNVPGIGKKNRLAVMDIPEKIAPVDDLISQAIYDQCQTNLHPPVAMVGIPAMRKIAREITSWPDELGDEIARKCLYQAREYLNSPPDIEGNHLTGGRDLYITFLQEAGELTGLDFSRPINRLNESIAQISALVTAMEKMKLEEASASFDRFADAEEAAYTELEKIIAM